MTIDNAVMILLILILKFYGISKMLRSRAILKTLKTLRDFILVEFNPGLKSSM